MARLLFVVYLLSERGFITGNFRGWKRKHSRLDGRQASIRVSEFLGWNKLLITAGYWSLFDPRIHCSTAGLLVTTTCNPLVFIRPSESFWGKSNLMIIRIIISDLIKKFLTIFGLILFNVKKIIKKERKFSRKFSFKRYNCRSIENECW